MTVARTDRPGSANAPPKVRASTLLRVRTIWMVPLLSAAVLVFFMTLFYIGAIVNPAGHLSGLPVLLVNQDSGASVSGSNVNLGSDVASSLLHSRQVTSRLALKEVTLARAETQMNSNQAYATIEIPSGFSDSMLYAYGLSAESTGVPTITLATNPRAGSTGVQLATGVAEPALQQISRSLGSDLSSQAAKAGVSPHDGFSTANPVTIATSNFRSVPANSALGLSAFYISLLAIMCGFLGAVLVNSSIDAALGFSSSEVGTRWRQRIPVAISRWQTLLAKWCVCLGVVPLLTGILLVVSAVVLGMDAPHAGELWLFTSLAGLAISAGTLALFAAFGSIGQLLAMLLFVYLALASSGGTIPLQALPSFFRFAAIFEPLRQVIGGVRSILYFNAQGDAGLTRGVTMSAIGLVFWMVVGATVTRWYDRRGLERVNPDLVQFMHQSANEYLAAQAESHASAGRSTSASVPVNA
jgi:YhgE/Pip-like protein